MKNEKKMTKEKQIRKMLEYLSRHDVAGFCSSVRQSSDKGRFFVSRLIVEAELDKRDGEDIEELTIDFNKKSISWYTAFESGHNGDHFGCKDQEIPWKTLSTSFDWLKAACEQRAKLDAAATRAALERDLDAQAAKTIVDALLRSDS